jgi:hypothetical protein
MLESDGFVSLNDADSETADEALRHAALWATGYNAHCAAVFAPAIKTL